MSKLDVAKEQIAYLKLWLGAMIVTDIGLIGWFVTNVESVRSYKFWSAAVTIGFIFYAGYRAHELIQRKIAALEDL